MKRILRFLRSPKLALGLALGIAAFSFVGTLIPQTSQGAASWSEAHPTLAVAVRALGLFHVFTSPAFLAAVALLAACTVACAWTRTRSAMRVLRWGRGTIPDIDALRGRRSIEIGPPDATIPADESLARASEVLSRGGMRTARRGDVMRVSRREWGAVGSPLFHWSLALLVLVIALGQLTRAEGRLPIPVGGQVTDAAENYAGRIDQGPLFPDHTGLTLSARDFQLETVVGGVDRGPTAIVSLRKGSTLLAETRVYPNSPLRYGSLLVHQDTWGYAPLFSVESTSGSTLAEAYGFVLESEVTSRGAGPGVLHMSGAGEQVVIGFDIPAVRSTRPGPVQLSPSVRVSVRRGDEPTATPVALDEGDRTPLFDGMWLRFVKRGEFVRVAVANDWSVPWIYALFAAAAIGLAVALFARPQGAFIFADDGPDGIVLRAVSRTARPDAAFLDRLRNAAIIAVAASGHHEKRKRT